MNTPNTPTPELMPVEALVDEMESHFGPFEFRYGDRLEYVEAPERLAGFLSGIFAENLARHRQSASHETLTDVPEPSDAVRSSWPEITRRYVEALENSLHTQGGKQSSHTAGEGLALAQELAECEIAPFPHSLSEYYVVLVDEGLRTRILAALSATQSSHTDLLEALERVVGWLTACLDCERFQWDGDQHEYATLVRDEALAAIAQHKGQSK